MKHNVYMTYLRFNVEIIRPAFIKKEVRQGSMDWCDGFGPEVQDGMQSPENGHSFTGPKLENVLYGLRALINVISR